MDVDRFALEPHFTVIERVDAGNALDQGGLTGSVIADKSHHLASTDLKVDIHECVNLGERLGDADAFQ
jgi:hypothetical protein